MSATVPLTLARPREGSLSYARWPAVGGVIVLAVAWPFFVFTGTQTSYLVSTAAACCTAVALAVRRSSLVVGYLAGLMALIGPDVNGQLGSGHATLGSLRLVDAATVTAAAVAVVVALQSARVSALRSWRPGALSLLSVAGVIYATLRWWTVGHPVDGFLRADLRLIILATLFWLIVTRCARGGAVAILWALVAVGVLAGIKAAAINLSGVYAIGSFDRLQAADLYVNGRVRTILIGGDTLLILVPAVAVLLARVERRTALRIALALAGLFCTWTLGLSVTRTSVLATVGLVLAAIVAILILVRPPLSRRTIAAGMLLTALILTIPLVGGTAARLTRADPVHVGLNFRKDEVNNFLNSSAKTKYLGMGLAGRFNGKDVNGKPVPAGWAHELPVWIALKTGLLGLLCATLALGVIARRVVKALKHGADKLQVVAGALFVLGVVVISMTLDRLALPEGAMPFIVGVYLISSARPPTASSA